MVTGAEIGEGEEVLEIGGERMKYGQSDLTAVISVKYSPPPQCLRYKVTKLKKKIKINRESKIALI